MLKKAIFLTLLLQSVYASAQTTVLVHLPPSGQYVVFSSHGVPVEIPTSPTAAKGGDASVLTLATDDQISVWNKVTGNVGTRPISKVASGWTVADPDLDHVALVDVKVQHNGNPVAAAQVELEDGSKREPEIVDPTSAGTATFFNVKPGRQIITVRVKGSASITQIFPLSLTRTDTEPKFTISVAEAAEAAVAGNVGAGKPSAGAAIASTGAAPAANPPASTLGSVITYLLALLVAGGVGFAIFTFIKKNPDSVSQKLEQLGVQIPKPDHLGAAGGAPVPFDPQPKPAPPQKILLDDSAPTPLVAPMPSAFDPVPIFGEPSLVSSAGISIPLTPGETVVGRDAGLGLSLTGESSISRRHATLFRNGTEVTVTDLGSTNGTFLNGAKLQAAALLRSGDTVQFGSVPFRFQG